MLQTRCFETRAIVCKVLILSFVLVSELQQVTVSEPFCNRAWNYSLLLEGPGA